MKKPNRSQTSVSKIDERAIDCACEDACVKLELLVYARYDLPVNGPCLERVHRIWLHRVRAFPKQLLSEFRGHVCPGI